MEPKYRTLLQAALMVLVLAVMIGLHDSSDQEQAFAQQTEDLR